MVEFTRNLKSSYSVLTLHPALEYSWSSLIVLKHLGRKSHMEINRKIWLDNVQEKQNKSKPKKPHTA